MISPNVVVAWRSKQDACKLLLGAAASSPTCRRLRPTFFSRIHLMILKSCSWPASIFTPPPGSVASDCAETSTPAAISTKHERARRRTFRGNIANACVWKKLSQHPAEAALRPGQAALLRLNAQNNSFYLLALFQDFKRMLDALSAQIADVDQSAIRLQSQ